MAGNVNNLALNLSTWRVQVDSRKRGQRGSVLVEGTLGVCMIIVGTIISLFFLTEVLLLVNYQQKIGLIANTVIAKAAKRPPFASPQQLTQAQLDGLQSSVNDGLTALGLPSASNLTVQVTGDVMKLSFRVEGLKLIAGGQLPFLPRTVAIGESVAAIVQCSSAQGLESFSTGYFPGGYPGITYYMPPGQYGTWPTPVALPFYGVVHSGVTNLPGAHGQNAQPTTQGVADAAFRSFSTPPAVAKVLYWQSPYGIVTNDNNGYIGGYSNLSPSPTITR
jgi:hypothetical protein